MLEFSFLLKLIEILLPVSMRLIAPVIAQLNIFAFNSRFSRPVCRWACVNSFSHPYCLVVSLYDIFDTHIWFINVRKFFLNQTTARRKKLVLAYKHLSVIFKLPLILKKFQIWASCKTTAASFLKQCE